MTRKRKSNRAAGESTAEHDATTSGDELSGKSLYEVPTNISARCVDQPLFITF